MRHSNECRMSHYGVATISRLLKIIGLFCSVFRKLTWVRTFLFLQSILELGLSLIFPLKSTDIWRSNIQTLSVLSFHLQFQSLSTAPLDWWRRLPRHRRQCASSPNPTVQWRGPLLVSIGHFSQKSPVTSVSFAENDHQSKRHSVAYDVVVSSINYVCDLQRMIHGLFWYFRRLFWHLEVSFDR